MKKKTEKEQRQPALRIIPLGGLEQIGMNITAFEYEDSIIVVDCGLAFPEDDMFGRCSPQGSPWASLRTSLRNAA